MNLTSHACGEIGGRAGEIRRGQARHASRPGWPPHLDPQQILDRAAPPLAIRLRPAVAHLVRQAGQLVAIALGGVESHLCPSPITGDLPQRHIVCRVSDGARECAAHGSAAREVTGIEHADDEDVRDQLWRQLVHQALARSARYGLDVEPEERPKAGDARRGGGLRVREQVQGVVVHGATRGRGRLRPCHISYNLTEI